MSRSEADHDGFFRGCEGCGSCAFTHKTGGVLGCRIVDGGPDRSAAELARQVRAWRDHMFDEGTVGDPFRALWETAGCPGFFRTHVLFSPLISDELARMATSRDRIGR